MMKAIIVGMIPALHLAVKTEVITGFFVDAYVDPDDSDYSIFKL